MTSVAVTGRNESEEDEDDWLICASISAKSLGDVEMRGLNRRSRLSAKNSAFSAVVLHHTLRAFEPLPLQDFSRGRFGAGCRLISFLGYLCGCDLKVCCRAASRADFGFEEESV
ncbi:uncharacterized protein Dmoj_GI26511 [Drosophila mojavensis]|uniref:Uncharacterized protein n=1 Tax=Drosophila mojavensis TaxID=7230 RepID=A0A0Q9XVH9_DROMO|nr:uncharacterized protein Dmoj_GI26664 [Drosophila mojavensis]KRG07849.1 uncharacterized protein Dmoj_GI26009 [Drosophila mojavensis]KRG07901.1 uncharacterized protein Dmoj_GI26511 [Drosophila mojavensis]